MTATTMVVLLLILLVGAFIGWRALSAPFPGSGDSTSSVNQQCVKGLKRGQVVHSDEVTVSVYNAGTRSGLAGTTLQQLLSRDFIPGDVGNAPGNLSGVHFVRVLSPTKTDPAARLVARQFGLHTAVQVSHTDLGPGVEVIVGDRFVGLKKAPKQLKARASGSGC
jgi:hypothetical protein